MLPKSEQDKIIDEYFSMPVLKWWEKYWVSWTIGRIWFGKKWYNYKATRAKSSVSKIPTTSKQPTQIQAPKWYYNFTKTIEYAYLPR